MRLGPKTCPTPEGPVDEKALYEGFIRFREGLRWKWFFNKNSSLEEVLDNHTSHPWDEKTDRSAPVAQDCPELEALISAVYKDLFDPALRKKIKGNLSKEQRDFILEVKTEYPKRNIRIRREDKGSRFVVVDGDEEDKLIEDGLHNAERFRESEENPIEEYNERIEGFAAAGVRDGEITEEQGRYITNQQKPSTSIQ